MKKKTKKLGNHVEQIIIYVTILVLLLLTAFNIQNYLGGKKVLGASIVKAEGNFQVQTDRVFWNDFVNKNPKYIPGWIELGRMDKVREIDPNYF